MLSGAEGGLKITWDTASDDKALIRYDPLQRYLSEISHYKLITREREKELGQRIQEDNDND